MLDWLTSFINGDHKIAPAMTLPENPDIRWDNSADIVIVGFGGAGAAAAVDAAEQKQDVLVLERFNGGGSTRISGGIYYAGGGTNIQQQAGFSDSADNMFRYLQQEVKDSVAETTLRDFCNQSVDNIDWLQQHGVRFHASYCPYKTSYPPNSYYFYYSGNEAFPPYCDHAEPVPRGHRAHHKGVSGETIFEPLRQSAAKLGARTQSQSNVRRLITDESGRVIGVEAHVMPPHHLATQLHRMLFSILIFLRYGAIMLPVITYVIRGMLELLENRYAKIQLIHAKKAVILAGGGFYFNKNWVKKYAPSYLAGTPLGTIGDNGAAIALGQSVGGATAHMDSLSAWRFMNPPSAFIRGVLIDAKAKRICNEMLYGAQVGEKMMKEHNGKGFLIIDHLMWRDALRECVPSKTLWFQAVSGFLYLFLERKKASTLDALAHKTGLPVTALLDTIEQYNAQARSDQPDPTGKLKNYCAPIQRAPFYALNCSFDSKIVPCPTLTLGGLRVDERSGNVLNNNDKPIAGLYAAGRTAAGIPSRSYVSGLSIADCIFSARRAVRAITGSQI